MKAKLKQNSTKRNFEGVNLKPILIQEPKYGRMLDVAPLVYTITDVMEGPKKSADYLSEIIEDTISSGAEIEPDHIFHLGILRRAIAAMISE